MHHARDNVFACSTLSLDEDWNIGAREFGKPIVHGLPGLGSTKNDGVGRHFPQRLGERIDTAGCHSWFLATGEKSLTCTWRAKAIVVSAVPLKFSLCS